MSLRVLLADDHPLFRQAMTASIQRVRPGTVVEEVDSLAEACAALKRDPQVALVLLDLKLTDAHGLEGLMTLRTEFPQAPVAIVSASEDGATISNAMVYGAVGFIPKSAGLADLGAALEAILEGDVWLPPGLALPPPMREAQLLASLSSAQMRIFTALRQGQSNKEIAFEAGVTEATVKAHLTQIFKKLNVANRTQAYILLQAAMVDEEAETILRRDRGWTPDGESSEG